MRAERRAERSLPAEAVPGLAAGGRSRGDLPTTGNGLLREYRTAQEHRYRTSAHTRAKRHGPQYAIARHRRCLVVPRPSSAPRDSGISRAPGADLLSLLPNSNDYSVWAWIIRANLNRRLSFQDRDFKDCLALNCSQCDLATGCLQPAPKRRLPSRIDLTGLPQGEFCVPIALCLTAYCNAGICPRLSEPENS